MIVNLENTIALCTSIAFFIGITEGWLIYIYSYKHGYNVGRTEAIQTNAIHSLTSKVVELKKFINKTSYMQTNTISFGPDSKRITLTIIAEYKNGNIKVTPSFDGDNADMGVMLLLAMKENPTLEMAVGFAYEMNKTGLV